MMPDKFRVPITKGLYQYRWPDYFENFYYHCLEIANKNHWMHDTVMNYELKPLGGRLIRTETQGWYLRWDTESAHTAFVLRWA